MRIELFTYKFLFVEPFRSAAGTFKGRKGLLIRLQKSGITALGEVSPLPSFSNESLSEIIAELPVFKENIKDHFASSFTLQSTLQFLQKYEHLPSLQFGLLTLAATFLSQQKNIPLQQLFSPESRPVEINAVVGIDSGHRMKKVERYVNQGYKTVKLKADSGFSEFLFLVETIRSRFPQLSLRIDANQRWTFDQAETYLSELAPYRIEYCEEPLANPDAKTIRLLLKKSTVPLALDESVFQRFSLSQAAKLVPVLIVKPAVWGTRFLMDNLQTRQNKPKLVFTTALESSVGRLMVASLASSFGTESLAHGVDTGSMLADDIWRDDQFTENGYFHLPEPAHLEALMNSVLPGSIIHKISTIK
jgi:O-succinylbenzoate synthase